MKTGTSIAILAIWLPFTAAIISPDVRGSALDVMLILAILFTSLFMVYDSFSP
jgi:hypothetical protein